MQKTDNGNRLPWLLFTTLVAVTLTVAGALGSATWQQESRLSRNETCVEMMQADLQEVKEMQVDLQADLQEVKEMLRDIRRYMRGKE